MVTKVTDATRQVAFRSSASGGSDGRLATACRFSTVMSGPSSPFELPPFMI